MSSNRGKYQFWRRIGSRLFPKWIWSGAGVIVEKVHRDAVEASVTMMPTIRDVVSGIVPERWVLVVKDAFDKDHYVNVGFAAWESHCVGDIVTAEYPLINHP